MNLVPGVVLSGKYELKHELGSGAMGVVWLAMYTRLGKPVAIKCLPSSLLQNPEILERFWHEARSQSRPSNAAYIVNTMDFFEEDGQYFLVMEYIEGEDLGKKLRAEGKLTAFAALRILKNVLLGLAGAHQIGLIHRDIKPSNIMIDKTGFAKLTDFGIALAAGETRLTRHADMAVGTSWYMSPEQIKAPRTVTAASDIYSVGILLYEMLTGKVPFDGGSDYEIEDQHIRSAPPDPKIVVASIPKEVAQLVLTATRKSPEQRFSNCEQFLAETEKAEAVLKGQGGPSKVGLYYSLFATALVGAGLAIAFLYLKDDASPKAQPNYHEMAILWIQAASEKGTLVCRDFKQIEPKKRNMAIAESIQDTAYVESYRKQIADLEESVQQGNMQYIDLVKKLATLRADEVQRAFAEYGHRLEENQQFEQLYILRSLLARHYEQSASGKALENALTAGACST